jgi:UDP-GlcNAc3NAcA epimerase
MDHTPFVLSVVGARPQFVKAAVVSRALSRLSLHERIVHTGQHYDHEMSGQFFAELGIPAPFVNLGVGSASHGEQTADMLVGLERIMVRESPAAVLVYGDTNSTLAAALAAAKLHIPILHVEAGLRSGNLRMPEEVNRILTDRISTRLFAPSEVAVRNLVAESFDPESILAVGDVMYDAVLHARALTDWYPKDTGYILASIHRAENTDHPSRLLTIFAALDELAVHRRVVMPLHPRTRAALTAAGIRPSPRIELLAPVGYLEMMRLIAGAGTVVTDSGGLQKEAYFHQIPCVTLRDETEWKELIDVGWNRLAPPLSVAGIVHGVASAEETPRSVWTELYGDGTAGERIAAEIASFLL